VPSGVQAGHAQRVLRRLRAAIGEEHLVEVTGSQLGDQPGRLAAGVVGERRRDRAQPRRLLLDRGYQLGVLVADIDVDQLRGEVEVAFAAVVSEMRSTRAGDRHRVDQRLRRPGVEHVRPVIGTDARFVGGDATEYVSHVHDLATSLRGAYQGRMTGRPSPQPAPGRYQGLGVLDLAVI
jgi:hypothetical protein